MKTTTNVGDDIDQDEAGWEFDDDVADQFDSHVRKSIPHYNEIQTQVAKLSDWFITTTGDDPADPPVVFDLGCATGETLTRLAERHAPGIHLVGVDEARPMLDKAANKVPTTASLELREQDITADAFTFDTADTVDGPPTLVTSLFTLSFLSFDARRALIADIYDTLPSGGGFIMAEKTRPESGFLQSVYSEHYWDRKSANGLADDEILGKARSLRGQLRPMTVTQYQQMFADAGFRHDDTGVFFKWNQWVGIVARKSPTAATTETGR